MSGCVGLIVQPGEQEHERFTVEWIGGSEDTGSDVRLKTIPVFRGDLGKAGT